jgi:hypothetical protein
MYVATKTVLVEFKGYKLRYTEEYSEDGTLGTATLNTFSDKQVDDIFTKDDVSEITSILAANPELKIGKTNGN